MWINRILLLTLGTLVLACADQSEPSTTLLVSTSTTGQDPDRDGYQLRVDEVDTLDLDPTARVEVDVEPGLHSLKLGGVADQCTVAPAPEIEVEVLAASSTEVEFAVNCPATRARVTVRTTGLTPDRDGYLLTVDGVDSLDLDPFETRDVELLPGRHTLSLLDVSGGCSVSPAPTIEVNVASGITTPVLFEVSCSTGARITLRTAGLDIDPDGYRVEVDDSDRGPVGANGTALTPLEAGTRTIALTGVAPNCGFDGPSRRTVTITAGELLPIDFALVCAATTGVIGVIVSGGLGPFDVVVDGATAFSVGSGGRAYKGGFPAGDHVVSMDPSINCSIGTGPQTVTVTTGTVIRDTVEVVFSVTCETALLFTAPTSGIIPQTDYSLGRCVYLAGCTAEDGVIPLGRLPPNDTLLIQVDPGTYRFRLSDLPSNCSIDRRRNPTPEITIAAGELRAVTFPVRCG